MKEKIDKSNPNCLLEEKTLWNEGVEYVAGVDEVGRGPFAGPVIACAVIMPKDFQIKRLTDSKKISKKEHEYFAEEVKKHALAYALGEASVEEIDEINIKKASQLAMKRAIENLKITPEYILVDGTEVIDTEIPQKSIIKGDYNSHTISAAAIVAKVHRDEIMKQLDEEYGNIYGWAKNAGYQTKDHITACRRFGITKHHRKTWATMENIKK